MSDFQDDNEDFCEGDVPVDEIDWSEVERLSKLQSKAGSDEMKNLALLEEMYGEDLELM